MKIEKKLNSRRKYFVNENNKIIEIQCSTCDNIKPISEFTRKTDAKLGFMHECKSCFAPKKKLYKSKRKVGIVHWKELQLNKAVNSLVRRKVDDIVERMGIINKFIEKYDMNLKPYMLEKLSDYVLHENSNNPDKVSTEEYPVLSQEQLSLRLRREIPMSSVGKVTKLEKWKDSKLDTSGRLKGVDLWSKRVKNRDNWTCQKPNCKGTTEIVHAHHIENYADNLDLAMDDDNGITLCMDCHYEFHSIYGKKKNTREQLDEWFGL